MLFRSTPPLPLSGLPPSDHRGASRGGRKNGVSLRAPSSVCERGKRTDLGEKTPSVWYACAPPLRLPALLWLWVCTHCVSGYPRCFGFGCVPTVCQATRVAAGMVWEYAFLSSTCLCFARVVCTFCRRTTALRLGAEPGFRHY